MASGDTLVQIPPQDFIPENEGAPSGGAFGLVASGYSRALSFGPSKDTGAYAVRRMPATYSDATGVTINLLVSDDPLNPAVSKNARFGVSIIPVGGSGAYYPFDNTNVGTEQKGTVTLASTAGQAAVPLTITVAKAVMGGVVSAKFFMLRVRRLGTDALDTATAGRVLVHNVTITET